MNNDLCNCHSDYTCSYCVEPESELHPVTLFLTILVGSLLIWVTYNMDTLGYIPWWR